MIDEVKAALASKERIQQAKKNPIRDRAYTPANTPAEKSALKVVQPIVDQELPNLTDSTDGKTDEAGKNLNITRLGIASHEPPNIDSVELPDWSKKGRPLKTSGNLLAIMNALGYTAMHNSMTAEIILTDTAGVRVGSSPNMIRSILVDACQKAGVPDTAIDDHFVAIAERESMHPVKQWLAAGKWDGTPRVNEVIDTLNAKDPEFCRAVMRPWLVGCIAALYNPKWIGKLVPVLQGAQSFMKSAWISRLASVVERSLYVGDIDPTRVDGYRAAVEAWIVEMAELESTTKREAGALKSFITSETDTFRIPYAKNPMRKKRQTSFIGTVNGTDFLKDPTGNARFAVIEMSQAANMDALNRLLGWKWDGTGPELEDPEALRQFWLEVVWMYNQCESCHLDQETLEKAADVNNSHTDYGPEYATIADYHLSLERGTKRRFTASELRAWHGDACRSTVMWGRALAKMAEMGLIEAEKLRGNRIGYWVPVQNHESTDLAADRGATPASM